jgi:hypothetical protein
MWIVAERGFVSIVQKPWDKRQGTLTVRARCREDLEAFLGSKVGIEMDDAADYRFRCTRPAEDVADWMAFHVRQIDYPNFKDAVQKRQGADRAALYTTVWSTLQRLQALDEAYPDLGALLDEAAHTSWPKRKARKARKARKSRRLTSR